MSRAWLGLRHLEQQRAGLGDHRSQTVDGAVEARIAQVHGADQMDDLAVLLGTPVIAGGERHVGDEGVEFGAFAGTQGLAQVGALAGGVRGGRGEGEGREGGKDQAAHGVFLAGLQKVGQRGGNRSRAG